MSITTRKPIKERIGGLIKLNSDHSTIFSEGQLQRRLYRAHHPTEICAFKCMDGRINLPAVTKTPMGIIQPFRNIGGKFNLGWPFLGETLKSWVDYSINHGRNCLALITYHYSAGDNHRGCAGHNYDTQAAIDASFALKDQFYNLFGQNNGVVFPVVIGLETDSDALIIHGDTQKKIELIKNQDASAESMRQQLKDMFPGFPDIVIDDFLPLIMGNIKHIKEIKDSKREIIDSEHREWILGIGRGFDWLHDPNKALIVGPFDVDLATPIITAARIIEKNIVAGRIPDDGFLLLLSASYRSQGVERQIAIEKVRFLKNYAENLIKDNLPNMFPKMYTLSVVVDANTRKMEIVN